MAPESSPLRTYISFPQIHMLCLAVQIYIAVNVINACCEIFPAGLGRKSRTALGPSPATGFLRLVQEQRDNEISAVGCEVNYQLKFFLFNKGHTYCCIRRLIMTARLSGRPTWRCLRFTSTNIRCSSTTTASAPPLLLKLRDDLKGAMKAKDKTR